MTEKTLRLKAEGVGFDKLRTEVRTLFAEVRKGMADAGAAGVKRVKLTRSQHKEIVKLEKEHARNTARIAKAQERQARTDKKRLQQEQRQHNQRMRAQRKASDRALEQQARQHAARMAAAEKAAQRKAAAQRDRENRERVRAEERANKQIIANRRKMIDKLGGLVVGVGSIAGAQKTFDLAREGAKLIALEKAYLRTGRTLEDLQEVIDAAGGGLSKRTALQLANSANLFNINHKTVVQFAGMARAAAAATGKSIEYMFESIVLGTARTSPKILDNLGIIVQQRKAYEELAAQLGTTVDMLTESQKKQAFLNAVIKAGNEVMKKAPYDQLNSNIERTAANVENLKDQFKKLIATKFVGPLAEALTGNYASEPVRDKRTRNILYYETLRSTLDDIRKTATHALPSVEQLNVAFGHLATQERPDVKLDKRFQSLAIRSQAIATLEKRIARYAKIVKKEAKEAELANRLKKLKEEDEKAAKAIDEQNAVLNKQIDKRIKEKERKAKQAAARAHRERIRFLKSLGKTELEIIGSISKHVVQMNSQSLLQTQIAEARKKREKEVFEKADKANEAFLESERARISFLQAEIRALDAILSKRQDLSSIERERLGQQLDQRRGEVAVINVGSIDPDVRAKAEIDAINSSRADRQNKRFEQGKAEGAAAGLLATIGETDTSKLEGIKAAIHENIVQPLTIASDTAYSFGRSMADAAATAIFEGKSFKKATNEVLKDLARRSTSNAIFHAAASAASAAIGDYKGAGLHLKASLTFGLVAGATVAGAAATGGVRDSNTNRTRTTPADRPVSNSAIGGRTQDSGKVTNIYISLASAVATSDTARELYALINSAANTPGGPKINLSAIEGDMQRFNGAS